MNRFDPDAKHPDSHEKQDLKDSVDPQAADCNLDVASSGDEEEELKDVSTPGRSQSHLKGERAMSRPFLSCILLDIGNKGMQYVYCCFIYWDKVALSE